MSKGDVVASILAHPHGDLLPMQLAAVLSQASWHFHLCTQRRLLASRSLRVLIRRGAEALDFQAVIALSMVNQNASRALDILRNMYKQVLWATPLREMIRRQLTDD